MRTYQLTTGNQGLVDYYTEHPLTDLRWRMQAELDETGKVGESYAVVIDPEGEQLGRLKLGPRTRGEVEALIKRDFEAWESAPNDEPALRPDPAPPAAERTRYRGTTGDVEALKDLKYYSAADWELEVSWHAGLPREHVQVCAPDGRAIANVPVSPRDSLVTRTATAIREHRAKGTAHAAGQAVITVERPAAGGLVMSLWESEAAYTAGETSPRQWIIRPGPHVMGEYAKQLAEWREKFPGARLASDVSLMDMVQDESADADLAQADPARPEWVKCASCGTLHRATWSNGQVDPMLQQCDCCYDEYFLPCEAPASGEAMPVSNPRLGEPPEKQVAAAADLTPVPTPLITVELKAGGRILVRRWDSGVDGSAFGGESDGSWAIRSGQAQRTELHEILAAVLKQNPDTRIESDVEIVEAFVEEARAKGRRVAEGPKGQVAAAADPAPAKQAPPAAVETARAQRQAGQDLQPAPGAEPQPRGEEVREIAVGEIHLHPKGNVRKTYDPVKMDELTASVREHGVLQPVLVNQVDDGYQLIFGHRRWMASKNAGRLTIRAMVVRVSQAEALEMMAVENLQREDLNPIDEAGAYQQLLVALGTAMRVADRVGKSRQHVQEWLMLLDLPADLQHQVATGVLSVKAGLEFLRKTRDVTEPVKAKVAEAIKREAPSVRQAPAVINRVLEEEGAAHTAGSAVAGQNPDKPPVSPDKTPEKPVTERSTPDTPPAPRVDPNVERARALAEIGRTHWKEPFHSNPDGSDDSLLLARECYLPLERLLSHWQARRGIGATAMPEDFGTMEFKVPELGFWVDTGYCSSKPGVTLNGTELTAQNGKGGIRALHIGNPVYYRVDVRKGAGGTKTLTQQLVIQDGGRHLVLLGDYNVLMRGELVPKWADLVGELPGLPEG